MSDPKRDAVAVGSILVASGTNIFRAADQACTLRGCLGQRDEVEAELHTMFDPPVIEESEDAQADRAELRCREM